MGGSIDQWLTQGKPATTNPTPDAGGGISRWLSQDDTARLRLSADLSNPLKADRAARVLRLHDQTRVPIEIIDQDPDSIEQAYKQRMDADVLSRHSPATASWLADRPEHVSAAGDDIPKLSQMEHMVRALKTGARVGFQQSEQGRIGADVANQLGGMTTEQRDNLNRLNDEIQKTETGAPVGEFLNVLYQGAKIYGQMAESLPEVGTYGAAGTAAGAVASGLLIGAGIATAPATLILGGLGVGMTYGFTQYTFRTEGGQAYLELSNIQDMQGNKLSEETKRNASFAVGAVNALLETTGASFIASPFRAAAKKFMRSSVEDALVRPTMATAMADFGKAYLEAIAGESTTEVMQELTNVVAEELAMKADKLGTPEEREDVMTRLASIAKQTAEGMLLVGLPGALLHGSTTAVLARRAQRREQLFTALGEGIKDNGIHERLPSAVQDIVSRATKDGPIENVYVPVETWDTYWQKQKQDPASLAEKVTGKKGAWEEATRNGGDIVIPMSRYATLIAPTDHNAFFAKELRTGPNEMSAREAGEVLAEQEKAATAATDVKDTERQQQAEQVGTKITEQLMAAGYDQTTAESYSTLYERTFKTLGERTGRNPLELFNQFNLNIQRVGDENQAQTEETVLNQDDLIKQFEAWKGASLDPEISQELRDLSWMRARDLEPHARAQMKEEFDKANADYKARTGRDWTYAQGPKSPAEYVQEIRQHIDQLKTQSDKPGADQLSLRRQAKDMTHLANIAERGVYSDVAIYLAHMTSADIHALMRAAPKFATWIEDMIRGQPDLKLSGDVPEFRRAMAEATKRIRESGDRPLPRTIADQLKTYAAQLRKNPSGEFTKETDAKFTKWVDKLAKHAARDNVTLEDMVTWVAKTDQSESFAPVVDGQIPGFLETLLGKDQEFEQSANPFPSFLGGFHSKAEQIIEQKMPNKASIKDIQGLLKDVKADEKKWLGLEDWYADLMMIEGAEEPIRKETVLDFLRANRLEIEEINQTNAEPDLESIGLLAAEIARNDARREMRESWEFVKDPDTGEWVATDITLDHLDNLEEARQMAKEQFEKRKYVSLLEGFSTRKEAEDRVIEHLIEQMDEEDLQEKAYERLRRENNGMAYETYTLPGGTNYREILFSLPGLVRRNSKYWSAHFEDIVNIFAHTRLKDRIGPDGEKILFIEEIQSDWHQEGRDKGYSRPLSLDELTIKPIEKGAVRVTSPDESGSVVLTYNEIEDKTDREIKLLAQSRHPKLKRIIGVPDAPFKNTWHEFAFKRILRMATDGGYDQVAWTTGDQQNARYNLEKHVDRIEYKPVYAASGTLRAYKNGQRVLNELIKPAQIADYVGKELAVRLLSQPIRKGRYVGEILGDLFDFGDEFDSKSAQRETIMEAHRLFDDAVRGTTGITIAEAEQKAESEILYEKSFKSSERTKALKLIHEAAASHIDPPNTHMLSGEQMRVGGQGMRGFYDDILPRFANQFGKKYQTGVTSMEISTAPSHLPGGRMRENGWDDIHEADGKFYISIDNIAYLTRSSAKFALELYASSQTGEAVHALPLSDALKQAALKDEFTLYQSPADARLEELKAQIAARPLIDLADMTYLEWWNGMSDADREAVARRLGNTSWKKPIRVDAQRIHDKNYDKLAAIKLSWQEWVKDVRSLPGAGILEQEARGRIRFGKNGINIDLLKTADPSTFIHETGHFFLNVMHELRDSSPEMRKDYDTLRAWMGASQDGTFTREQHELFARGFEKYLAEGRSPVESLRRVFVRFRVWLLSVYANLTDLNVELTDDVRSVFGRLLAGDQDVASAQRQQGMGPLFADPSVFGEAQAQEYTDAASAAENAASEEMAAKIIKDWRKETSRVFQAERDKVRQSVGEDANNDTVLRARALLSRGTLPNGDPLPEGEQAFKLSKNAILREHGEEVLRNLPAPLIWTANEEKGLHPDMAADLLGFKSGSALVKALVTSEDPRTWIDKRVNETMRSKKYQLSPLKEGEVPNEAMKAVHNEKRALLLRKELELLAAQHIGAFKGMIRAVTRRVPLLKDVREEAERVIAQKEVRTVKPNQYLRAEQTAHKNALEGFLKGDLALAFSEKQKELINHELYRAAANAIEEADKIATYARRFDEDRVRTRLAKAGANYLDQIDGFRERFEFTKVPFKRLSERQSLRQFLSEHEQMGFTPQVPEHLIDEAFRQNYRELTMEELRDVHSAMQQIERLARTKNRLLASARQREFNAARTEITDTIKANHKLNTDLPDLNQDFTDRIKQGVEGFMAAHNKAEFLFEWLDGYKELGPVWQYFFKPFVDAEANETKMMKEAVVASHDIFSVYNRNELADWVWGKQSFAMGNRMESLTKANIFMIALNWGNQYNRDAMLRGYERRGWTESNIQTVLNTMDQRDWDTVQKVWDWFESYWPQIERLERDVNGLPPGKVESLPVATKFGQYRGGYFPIAFDKRLSWRQAIIDIKQQVSDVFGGQYAHAMTKHGHTESRTNTGGKPLRLDLGVISEHVTQVIHDLTHRRAVIDVNRLIEDNDIHAIFEQSMGTELTKQLRPWLLNIAKPQRGDFSNPIESIMGSARTGATIVNLGWKMTTALTQFLGYTGTVNELGPVYSAKGLYDIYSRPDRFRQNWEFVTTRSEFMRHRLENYDRDVNDALKNLQIAGPPSTKFQAAMAPIADPVRRSFFTLIGLMDMGVSLPSWMGAYAKAMDGKVENIAKGHEESAIDYADKVVRQTQGVGTAKDLATIQRGPNTLKIFTMFYTYFAGLYNQFTKAGRKVQRTGDVGRFVASMALLWWVPAALGEAILGRAPSADDDPEEWAKWLISSEVTFPFQSIVLLRDVINGMRYHSYEPSAALDVFDAFTITGKLAAQKAAEVTGLSDETDASRYQKGQVAQAVGYVTKLPSRQLWLTGEYLYDWWTGEEDPSNLGEGLFRSLVAGKPRGQ